MFSEMPSCDTELVNLPQGPQWIWWLLSICPLPEHVQLLAVIGKKTTSTFTRIMAVSESLETPVKHVISYPHSVSGRGVQCLITWISNKYKWCSLKQYALFDNFNRFCDGAEKKLLITRSNGR